jgi:isochorismate pyruvate lyase
MGPGDAMDGDTVPGPALDDVRRRLDQVDERLVEVLAERSRLIAEVIELKRRHGIAVVDRAREDEMLARIEARAVAAGLDPRIARQILRAVIDAFTLLEVEDLGTAHGRVPGPASG